MEDMLLRWRVPTFDYELSEWKLDGVSGHGSFPKYGAILFCIKNYRDHFDTINVFSIISN